jgi:hypothetical protein
METEEEGASIKVRLSLLPSHAAAELGTDALSRVVQHIYRAHRLVEGELAGSCHHAATFRSEARRLS